MLLIYRWVYQGGEPENEKCPVACLPAWGLLHELQQFVKIQAEGLIQWGRGDIKWSA